MALQAKNQLWADGYDETVEVNQRALVDKVLARYSGEFTGRELLQNSDDAQAHEAEVRFETKGYLEDKLKEGSPASSRLPNLKTTLVHQWSFRNDGITFREEDWNRLKKIAEGNPDEEKIGAFGVGFYSLFSVTEEPFVTSGGEWMGFHWKKDQLLARRGKLPDTVDPSKWTSFEMALREDTPIPVAFDFTRFLASSITFMNHLSTVSVYFDDQRLAKLTKSSGIPKQLGLPKTLNVSNKSKMMTLNKLESTSIHIQADVMRWVYTSGSEKAPAPSTIKLVKPPAPGGFFASLFSGLTSASTTPQPPAASLETLKPIDPLKIDTTSVSLTIFSAEADVQLDRKLAAELHRSTKKSVPNKIKYGLIYTGMDEYKASKAEDEQQQAFATSGSIFQGLRADLDGLGSARIFIGHATSQTTGIGGHMSARFLPTVERESLDLMDRNVAIWNKELLHIGGTVSRAVYELEMDNIKKMSDSAGPGKTAELQSWLMDRAIHVLKFFTFHQSTPSADISSLLEHAFFACSTGFRIMSTSGIQDVADVRLPDAQFSSFLKDLPVLPEQLLTAARPMVTALQNRKLVKTITFSDVLKELSNRPLTEDESIACLTWWISLNKDGESAARLHSIRKQLLDAAVFTTGLAGSKEQSIIALNTIQTILNPRGMAGNIPSDVPFPPTMLPPSISKPFDSDQLTFAFHWTELTLVEWLRFIATSKSPSLEYNFSLSAHWSERVLGIIARAWPSLSNATKDEIVQALKSKSCVPTSHGSKVPEESYFANADIFHDLPVVKLPSGSTVKGNLERVLTALGVRRHVELQIIFTRMIKTNEWTISDLIKYLVSVKDSLSPEEKARLKLTNAFSAEPTPGTEKANNLKRYQANQLFEPSAIFIQLELPVIDWGTKLKWRSSSEEAKFLFDLGLQRYPSLPTIIELCASPKAQVRAVAFKYLLDNIKTKYKGYDRQDFYSVRFIPASKNSSPYLGSPEEVLSGQEWGVLGLPILTDVALDVGSKLGLREHPTSSFMISFLENTPPRDMAQATLIFSLMSNRISDFSSSQLQKLSQLPIVPTRQPKDSGFQISNTRPNQCFFGHEGKEGFHSKLFIFVDFGASANSFLSACGVKREPSVDEIALILLADPHNFYQLAGGPNSFLGEMRNIAVNNRLLSNGTVARLKKSPVLLALQRRVPVDETMKKEADEDWEFQYDLKRPDQIVIADDSNALQIFGDQLFVAPQEDILEAFYLLLGSKRLSTLVHEDHEITNEVKNSPQAAKLQAHILERLPLFLHEHTHAKTKTSFAWLTSNSNFIVRVFGKISVVKSLKFGSVNLSKRQAASAVGPRVNRGPLQIWLANDVELDMYEVATSFNRLFFETPKANDALLFMTILSTDLQALKRRGYNVERIERRYREQRAEQSKVAEERQAVKDGTAKALMSKPPTPVPMPTIPLPGAFPEMLQKSSIPSEHGPAPPSLSEKGLNPMGRPNSTLNSFHKLGRKLGFKGTEDSLDGTSGPSISRNPTQGATPIGNISANIDMAIKACRPESGNLLRNREQMQQVKESLNEGYCDISGRTEDLQHIGTVGPLKVYLSAEVPDKSIFLANRNASLQRFLGIVTSLARIYSLPLGSLHIFYDLGGPLIAFNRNASIFLNLRFYEAWHDSGVASGHLSTALVSWYFTLAHEIAHNLVQPHNSEHEFYFSAICEKHILQLGLETSKG